MQTRPTSVIQYLVSLIVKTAQLYDSKNLRVHFSSNHMADKVYRKLEKETGSFVFHPVFFMWYQAWEEKGKGSPEWHTNTRTYSQRCWPNHISSFSRSALLWSQVWMGVGTSCSSFTYCLQKTRIPAVVNGVTQSTSFPKLPFIVIIFTPDWTGIFLFFSLNRNFRVFTETRWNRNLLWVRQSKK